MMLASAARSTSVTKSLGALALTVSRSRSSEARLMMAPAPRAALMAVLSIGCKADWDMAATKEEAMGAGCQPGAKGRAARADGGDGDKERGADRRLAANPGHL